VMETSPTIDLLAASLAKAQGAMEAASKDKTNPHYKSKYADLASVWDAIREPISKNSLSVLQFPRTDEQGRVWLDTILMHSSGQWIRNGYSLPATKNDAQGFGSALTYMRRYALMGVGIAPEDDDAEGATKRESINPYSAGSAKQTNGNGNGNADIAAAKKWSDTAIMDIKNMPNARTLHNWEDRNKTALERLNSVNGDMFHSVMDTISARYEQLNVLGAG
jgi:hypothetical protein